MVRKTKKRLGEMLVEAGLIDNLQLEKALEFGKKHGLRLGKALTRLNMCAEEDIIKVISKQLDIPYLDVGNILFDPDVVSMVPENFAKRNTVLPLFLVEDTLTVALSDPLNIYLIDDLANITSKKINVVLSTETDIQNALKNFYSNETPIEEIQVTQGESDDAIEGGDRPVIKMVNKILLSAMESEASDIHIEPGKTKMKVRFRIDGVLRVFNIQIPTYLSNALISRIKIMANLDIAEKRAPQDGRFPLNISGHDYDVRVSTLPVIFGEKIVMRLLDKSSILVGMDALGLTSEQHLIMTGALSEVNGIILVTGPTGSGKTTTLYSALQLLNSESRNIITVEDPVEYQLKDVNQVQVNPQAGVTFASGLRSILRQDPDIIMVGEIRDSETAEIAVQAALTGHLVLSTLHTNDAIATVSRLLEMDIEPFLLASSIRAIVGQRLIRKLCSSCAELTPATEEEKEILQIPITQDIQIKRAKGCSLCNQTGYKGRIGLYEILSPDKTVRSLISKKATPDEIADYALKNGFTRMRENGLEKVKNGITTIEEVMRVTRG
jgi:type IV pilus assembly protein PilB